LRICPGSLARIAQRPVSAIQLRVHLIRLRPFFRLRFRVKSIGVQNLAAGNVGLADFLVRRGGRHTEYDVWILFWHREERLKSTAKVCDVASEGDV
jgi:hypothetical protein